ncbi:RNA polymerase sigma factor [Pedobacter montanisoli]|uniref:RNA polymerase sigma factor n=1 Tax=Pedobacter montanisoli TaxID=2923277 RepID=A0ABS9ZUH6_9SPHI|nr:RNA polymerase sigma factor [Pedobacter montanisoli]MCJ0742217.1 RNA polymerase sigma factor [Pedobacter montanisoli]
MDDIYVRKVCAGDTEAFRYFVEQYKALSISLAVSVVKDEFVAEEVVQDAFINAFRGIKNFKFKSKFSSWFYRIVLNEAFRRLKKMQKEIVDFRHSYDEEIADESEVLTLQQNEQVHLINEALKLLPARESLVLRLFYLQEESIKEVAAITGWTEIYIKVTLHRARKNMHAAIKSLLKKSNNS